MRPWRSRLPEQVRALPVGRGEKVLAGAVTRDGAPVGGTRDAFYARAADGQVRIPWERVEKADWDADSSRLTVTEVGTWGAPRPVHEFELVEVGLLLELVRERVTASVLLQRRVPVRGCAALTVIARRAPRGDQPISWVHSFEEGVDPDDPDVRRLAEAALARAQEETGLR